MSVEKKSLINALKTTKKANVASADVNATPASVTSKRMVQPKRNLLKRATLKRMPN